jgi:hypothetical protein
LRAGLDVVAVPYNTPALRSGVMTGTVSMTFNSPITAVPMVAQKQMKVRRLHQAGFRLSGKIDG